MTLDERILAYLDGSATETERVELDRVLDNDRAARDRFARLCEQDAALRQILSCAPAASQSKPRRGLLRRAAAGPTAPWAAIAFVAAALLFALILAAALSSGPSAPPRTPQIVRPTRPISIETPEPAPRVDPPKAPPVEVAPKKVEPPKAVVAIPKPDPKPEPPPEPAPKVNPPAPPPPPPPSQKVTEAVVIVARLERVKGQVQVESTLAKEGLALPSGGGVQTVGAESSVQLRMDATVIEVGGETRIARITNETGKKITLDLGSISAQVAKQPAGQPLVFLTPHAEARVLGTKLTLSVTATETRLEVREGRVKLTRLSDNSSVEVTAGQFALASDAVKPAARKIPPPSRALLEDKFEDDSRWTRLDGGFPTTVKGTVEVNLSPRGTDPYDGGGWHLSGGLRTRQSFTAPFKVSVDVEISHKSEELNTLVVFMPKATGPRTGKGEVAVRLRNGAYSLIVETQHIAGADASAATSLGGRWTIEFGPKDVSLIVNGKPVFSHAHGLTIAQEYFVELQGTAKIKAPDPSSVKFDNVTIEK